MLKYKKVYFFFTQIYKQIMNEFINKLNKALSILYIIHIE